MSRARTISLPERIHELIVLAIRKRCLEEHVASSGRGTTTKSPPSAIARSSSWSHRPCASNSCTSLEKAQDRTQKGAHRKQLDLGIKDEVLDLRPPT